MGGKLSRMISIGKEILYALGCLFAGMIAGVVIVLVAFILYYYLFPPKQIYKFQPGPASRAQKVLMAYHGTGFAYQDNKGSWVFRRNGKTIKFQ